MTTSDAASPGQDSDALARVNDSRDAVTTVAGEHSGPTVIALPGDIDVCIADQVAASVARALDGGAPVLIADASRTAFCDCSGVHALIEVHLLAVESGVKLRIAASPEVRRILQLTGADNVLDTYSSLADALAGDSLPI